MTRSSYRNLPEGDFRSTRRYLSYHVFAIKPKHRVPPQDQIGRTTWYRVMGLPTDVLLRTTDHMGLTINDMYSQWSAWVDVTPLDASSAPLIFEAALDTADELHAAPVIAMHGYYRQAFAALRAALETMTIGAALAVTQNVKNYERWREGAFEPQFGNQLELLSKAQDIRQREIRVGVPGLFGRSPDGVVQELYRHLSKFAHSRPGHTNADLAHSTTPVFRGSVFTDFWLDFCDTVAICYVLFKLGYPRLILPDVARPLYGSPSKRLAATGEVVLNAYF